MGRLDPAVSNALASGAPYLGDLEDEIKEIEMMIIALRDRLRLTLLSARISPRELARIAKLNPDHVAQICRGKAQTIRAKTVVAMACALGCTTDWLLGLSEQRPRTRVVRETFAREERRALNAERDLRRAADASTSRCGSRRRRRRSVLLTAMHGISDAHTLRAQNSRRGEPKDE